jgi:choline-sulfatase
MLRTADWKYTRYREGDGEEFYDMINDSGETISIIHHPAITWHRQLLDKHINETSDNFMSLQPAVDSRWRSHLPGYHNHHGVAAPMVP